MPRHLDLPTQRIPLLPDAKSPRHAADADEQLRFDEVDALADAAAVAKGREAFDGRVRA